MGVDSTDDPSTNWGKTGFLSEEQEKALKSFLTTQSENLETLRYTVESPTECALRFLRARKFDLEDSATIVSDALKKFKDGRAFEYAKMKPDEAGGCDISVMKTFYPHTMQGYDKLNRPILWEMDGQINAQAIATMTTKEGLLGYHFWTMNTKLDNHFTVAKERSPLPNTWKDSIHEDEHESATVFKGTDPGAEEKEDKFSYNPINTIAVMDMTDFGMAQCSKMCMDQLKLFISTDNICYPETLGKMLVVNAPMILTATWNVVKGWLDPRTVNKIEILSPSQSQGRIKEFIDEENIPPQYGGKGPGLYSPHPNCEFLWLGRGGEVTRDFVVPAGQHLTVDSYVSEGSVECTMSSRRVDSSYAEGAQKAHKAKGSMFGGSQTKIKQGSNVIVQGYTITPKEGNRERYLRNITLESDSAHEVTVTWKNTSRYSQRPLVYAFTPFAPASGSA